MQGSWSRWVAAFLLVSGWHHPAAANVYPTNVRINGSYTNLRFLASTNVAISYVLNEFASAGVSIVIKSNTEPVRTIGLTSGTGAARGSNYIVWNGRDGANHPLPPGDYSIHITAGATGHLAWTQISRDNDPANRVYSPTGIAVNRNPNSPFYGRVFVANSLENPSGGAKPGDEVGLIKANADGSFAADGAFSDGGWPWTGDFYSPWKVEVSADDFVYVNDWTTNGMVLRFDQTISVASRKEILRADNWPNSGEVDLSGPAISGTGTETLIWMADIEPAPAGVGIRRFETTAEGAVVTNDTGTTAVRAGFTAALNLSPYDVALDVSNRIYTIQLDSESGSPTYRVFRFPAYVKGSPALTNADWQIGTNDDNLRGAYGVAVNAAATRVAVALSGVGFGVNRTGAGVRVFDADNGAFITAISPAQFHDHTDVAWDNAGNLYTCDNWDGIWRAYSPPGTNAATTTALATIQITAPKLPALSALRYTNDAFQLSLDGEAGRTYVILSSTNLKTWDPVTTNLTSFAERFFSLPAPAAFNFYRAVVVP